MTRPRYGRTTDQQGEPAPAPQAVDLLEPGRPHPPGLGLHVYQSIFGVISRPPDGGQEFGVQLRGGRSHHLEVGKEAVGPELARHFGEEFPLAFRFEVMDGEAGHDDVEGPERPDRRGQVPLAHLNSRLGLEAPPGSLQHGGGPVHGQDVPDGGTSLKHEGTEPSVAAAEIEHRFRRAGEHLAEHVLTGDARWESVDPVQIPTDLVGVVPACGLALGRGHAPKYDRDISRGTERSHRRVGKTAGMAFGQQLGPPASARQVQELLDLLHDAGHTDFRDARGPMGFTQRQAAGKFTREEVGAFIERLQDEEQPESAPVAARPRPRPSAAEQALARMPAEQLAAELERRGWTVTKP